MSMIGTFDGFTASRLGIYAAQQALRVTGNNISNINTLGYTRQRVDQMSFKVGANDMYRSYYDNHIGSGALVTNINQIRDPYLDIRYRTASTETYHYDTWLSGLQEIASILDEVGMGDNRGDGLLYKQLQDMAEKLRSFSADPTNSNDGLVRESASALASLFRNYAGRLQELYDGAVTQFQNSLTEVNGILVKIRDLNKSIREAEIHGDGALEMRDERNRQIDALSQYVGIKVEYSYEDVGAGIKAEKLTIKLNNKNPDPSVSTDESVLVDGIYATQLSVPEKLPLLNSYTDDEKYEYLKGFKYLQSYSADDIKGVLDAYNQENSTDLKIEDLLTGKDADGKTIYYMGTDELDDADKVDNENFTIQLEKLLDAKGREWKNSTTTWEAVTGKQVDDFAWYEFPITIKGLSTAEGKNSFGIKQADGTTITYIIGNAPDPRDPADNNVYIDPDTVCDDDGKVNAEKFAKFLEGALKSRYEADYEVSAVGNKLVLKARTAGAPKNPPSLNDEPEDNELFDVGKIVRNPGYTTEAPEEGGSETKADGTTIDVTYGEVNGKWYKITTTTEHTREITLDDNDLRGILQAQREMLTEEGEFSSDYDVFIDENAAIKRGIPYYQQALDLLAQKFAESYNELNQGYMTDKDGYYIDATGKRITVQDLYGNPTEVNSTDGLSESQKQNLINNGCYLQDKNGYAIDKDGNLIKDENGNPIKIVNDNGVLKDGDGNEIDSVPYDKLFVDMEKIGAVPMGGVLFSNGNNGNDTTNITAKNIDISAGWSHGAWGLVPKFEKIFADENDPDGLEQSTKNTNANHMLDLINKSLKYNPNDLHGSDATGPLLFEGSFNDFLSYVMSVEASDERITSNSLNTSAVSLTELDYSREGVSGVDLNDEAMNMMQYQKAMNAAMRVMTAIDEVLDRLINNTGVAGR